MLLDEDLARIRVKEAIEYGLKSQRDYRNLSKNSRAPYAQSIIKTVVSFAEKFLNWISQLRCEFRARFAFSRQKQAFQGAGGKSNPCA